MTCAHPETDTPVAVDHDQGYTYWQATCIPCGETVVGWGDSLGVVFEWEP